MKNGLKECRNVKKTQRDSCERAAPVAYSLACRRSHRRTICLQHGMAARRLENYHSPQMREIKGAEKRMIVIHNL
jgi:hypothetical protein